VLRQHAPVYKRMLNATRIRLYPTEQQAQALTVQFGCARWVWNEALAKTQELYRATGKGLNYHAMAVRLPKLKQELEWLKDADSQVLQQSLQNLAHAFENFFARRGRYPRFKNKHGRQSIQYPQRVKLDGRRIYLPKVGWVRCIVHREIEGSLKTVTVSRNPCGQFHAALLTENGVALPAVSIEGKVLGVDVGLNHLAVTSDGSKFDNPRHLRKAERNLKRKQQSLSRKKKGSNRRNKARQLVARTHERVACARKDHLHKLSRRIVNENQVIAVEDLHVNGMLKNHSVARGVSDAGWGMLINFLEYKAARAGKAFVKCSRWFPSSKACSCCGCICETMPLEVRSWTCAHCGAHHDRDVNAAINIRDEGLRILAGGLPATASGGKVRHGVRRNPRVRAFAGEAGSPCLQAGE
jgi:putative transposase